MDLAQCAEIDIPTYEDERGVLSVLESGEAVPFDIQRAFYIRDVPDGAERGDHATKQAEQLYVAVSGAATVTVDDGEDSTEYRCDSAETGVYVPGGLWTTASAFADGTVLLVLSSRRYGATEHIDDYEEFTAWREQVETQ